MISAIESVRRGLKLMAVDPEFPDLIIERLPGNTQLHRSTRRACNQPLGFAEYAFNRRSFALRKGHDGRGVRGSEHWTHGHEPALIHSEGFPIAQNYCSLHYILQLANVARPVIVSEDFKGAVWNSVDTFTHLMRVL